MASYFDIKPSASTAEKAEPVYTPNGDHIEGLRRMNLLTPGVNAILDGLEDHTSSDDEEDATLTDEEDTNDTNEFQPLHRVDSKSKPSEKSHKTLSPITNTNQDTSQPQQHPGVPRLKKHPRLDRFHSLRSTLFSSHIADNMDNMSKSSDAEQEAKWKAEHDQRKGLNLPRTPEEPAASTPPTREGLARRMGDKLRKITSREVPTMNKIKEDDNESTASDTEDPRDLARKGAGNGGGIYRNNVDSPQGDAHQLMESSTPKDAPSQDSESLAPEDVDQIVDWVARKPSAEPLPEDWSDVSTGSETDDEASTGGKDLNDADVDELVRWISKRNTRDADTNTNTQPTNTSPPSTSTVTQPSTKPKPRHDSHSADFSTPVISKIPSKQSQAAETEEDHISPSEEPAELIRTVTREECDEEDEKKREAAILRWKLEKEREKRVGEEKGGKKERRPKMGDLRDEDVDELVQWVSRRNTGV